MKREFELGEVYRPRVHILKMKNGRPTVIKVSGREFTLRHEDQFRGRKGQKQVRGGSAVVVELEERIEEQDKLIRNLDNRMEKYVRNNDAIRELLRKYDCNELDAVLLVSWLRMYV